MPLSGTWNEEEKAALTPLRCDKDVSHQRMTNTSVSPEWFVRHIRAANTVFRIVCAVSENGRLMRHMALLFQMDTPRTHVPLDESQKSSHNQNLKRSGN